MSRSGWISDTRLVITSSCISLCGALYSIAVLAMLAPSDVPYMPAGRNDPLDCPSSSPSSCAELYGPVLSTIPSLSESLERMSISRGSTGDAASASLPKFMWFSNVTVPRRPRRSRRSESLFTALISFCTEFSTVPRSKDRSPCSLLMGPVRDRT